MLKLLRGTTLLLLLVCWAPGYGQEPKIEIRISGIPDENPKPASKPEAKFDPQLNAKLDVSYGSDTFEKTGKTIVASRLSLSQTFTVNTTGLLVRFEVPIGYSNLTPVKPLVFEIRRVQDGVPVEANNGPEILARVSVEESEIHNLTSWHVVDLSPPLKVKAGEQYALVLSSSSAEKQEYHWVGHIPWKLRNQDPGSYPGGQGRTRGNGAARAPDDDTPRDKWGYHFVPHKSGNGGGSEADYWFRIWIRP